MTWFKRRPRLRTVARGCDRWIFNDSAPARIRLSLSTTAWVVSTLRASGDCGDIDLRISGKRLAGPINVTSARDKHVPSSRSCGTSVVAPSCWNQTSSASAWLMRKNWLSMVSTIECVTDDKRFFFQPYGRRLRVVSADATAEVPGVAGVCCQTSPMTSQSTRPVPPLVQPDLCGRLVEIRPSGGGRFNDDIFEEKKRPQEFR